MRENLECEFLVAEAAQFFQSCGIELRIGFRHRQPTVRCEPPEKNLCKTFRRHAAPSRNVTHYSESRSRSELTVRVKIRSAQKIWVTGRLSRGMATQMLQPDTCHFTGRHRQFFNPGNSGINIFFHS